MDKIQQGWFSEINDELWPGQSFSLKVEEVLHHSKSKYQDILIVQTKNHGKALILDGIIQCTESDEFVYQEMIAFLPLFSHPNPKKVLIVGGGDGGVAREVTKHPQVKEIVQVEIDEEVVKASKTFLKSMSCGFNSDKLKLLICDGFEYMQNHQKEFDVIITDSSDPIGPATNLFTEKYFELLLKALKPNGIICSQSGTFWPEKSTFLKQTLENCKKHFACAKFTSANVPTYPNGNFALLLASPEKIDFVPKLDLNIPGLKYYSKEMHAASFVLPNFVKSQIR